MTVKSFKNTFFFSFSSFHKKRHTQVFATLCFITEAREHGVGYFAFSTDEDERKRQQKELETLHRQTVGAQQQREQLRNRRDQIIADRVKAAKARQRARQGLPPEEAETPEPAPQVPTEAEREQQAVAEQLAAERAAFDAKRESERQKHVRPWDRDKTLDEEDDEWRPRVEREPVSQDTWNERKREERVADFAPPSTYAVAKAAAPPPHSARIEEENIMYFEDRKGLFFTSKREKKTFMRKNYDNEQPGSSKFEPTPIENELSDEEKKRPKRKGAEIPPPPTWDYYTPEDKRPKKTTRGPSNQAVEDSIEAGLRFLREQSDKGQITTKNKWVSKADY